MPVLFSVEAALLACGGNGAVESQVPVPTGIETADFDPGADDSESPVQQLEATVLEIYSHLTLGNFAAYRDNVASEEPVMLFGVRPDDVLVGVRPPAALRDRRLYASLSPTLLAKNLDITISPDGSVAWTFDEMSYRVQYEGRTASIPIRNTGLYIRDFDRWVLVMEHQSYPTAIDDLRAAAAAGDSEQPRRFPTRHMVGPAHDLLRLVGLLHNAQPLGPTGRLAPGDEALVLLPDRDHELHGRDADQGPSLATLFGPSTTVGLRDYRIGVAKTQTVAWMAANLVVRTMVNEVQVDIGMRGTYVFRLDQQGWEVVQMHVSAPVSEHELSRRLFGSP